MGRTMRQPGGWRQEMGANSFGRWAATALRTKAYGAFRSFSTGGHGFALVNHS